MKKDKIRIIIRMHIEDLLTGCKLVVVQRTIKVSSEISRHKKLKGKRRVISVTGLVTSSIIVCCRSRQIKTSNLGNTREEKSKAGNPYNGKDKAGLIHSPTMTRKGLFLELSVHAVSKCLGYREEGNGLNLETGMVNGESVSVLRDTGCTAILVADKFIKRHDLTGDVREVTLANGYLEKCPEVWIEVDTLYVKGKPCSSVSHEYRLQILLLEIIPE